MFIGSVKKIDSNKRPKNSFFRFYVPPTQAKKNKGWNMDNSKTFYEVDTYFKRIVLIFQIKNRSEEVMRTTQYSDHFGGYFFVSEKQNEDFKRALKRIKSMAYKVEKE